MRFFKLNSINFVSQNKAFLLPLLLISLMSFLFSLFFKLIEVFRVVGVKSKKFSTFRFFNFKVFYGITLSFSLNYSKINLANTLKVILIYFSISNLRLYGCFGLSNKYFYYYLDITL